MERFSSLHPTVRLEVLDRLELRQGVVLFELRLSSDRPAGWTETLAQLPHVRSVELLSAGPRTSTYRIVYDGPTFLPVAKRLRLMRQFPFPIQAGVATWTIVGTEPKIRRLIERLRAARIRLDVEALRPGSREALTERFTARQQEVLSEAVRLGYFEVPRRITLTELAAKLRIAASTLSVTLALIEKKLVDAHVRAPPRRPGAPGAVSLAAEATECS